jgi:Leucine-rich repeat (LRR) protein
MSRLVNLRELYLSHNRLTSLAPLVPQMRQLVELYVAANAFPTFPSEVLFTTILHTYHTHLY